MEQTSREYVRGASRRLICPRNRTDRPENAFFSSSGKNSLTGGDEHRENAPSQRPETTAFCRIRSMVIVAGLREPRSLAICHIPAPAQPDFRKLGSRRTLFWTAASLFVTCKHNFSAGRSMMDVFCGRFEVGMP